MIFFTAFLLHLVFVVVVKAEANAITPKAHQPIAIHEEELNITAPAEDYVIHNQRQYDATIAKMDEQLIAFRFNYESELKTIMTQRDFFLQKLAEVDQRLYPLRFLSKAHKHCVQKYETKIATIYSANRTITLCATEALSEFNKFVALPQSTRDWLHLYHMGNVGSQLNRCKNNNPDTWSQNYTICVTDVIDDADGTTAAYVKRFNAELVAAHYSAESRVGLAIDCSFSIIYQRTKIIGETLSLIDNCAAGLETCPKCEVQPLHYCANQLALVLDASDLRSPTIRNPFYGLNGKIDCVLLNLDESTWNGENFS